MAQNLFLSVIVPVYNAEAYLGECLDSLLDQDCGDYEILCVNDGSTDRSPEILEEYHRRDPRVRVLHQENGGVTAARNAGLNAAQGEFIWFVDADDRILPLCLSRLKALAAGDVDRVVVGGYTFEDALSEDTIQQTRAGVLPLNVSWEDSVVWRNLLRREFCLQHGLCFRYPELTHGEDGLFMYEVSAAGPATAECADILYFYRVHSGSAETLANPQNLLRKVQSHVRVVEILSGYYAADRRDEDTVNRLTAFLWLSLYELAQLPRSSAAVPLSRLKALGLYPSARLPQCSLHSTYLTGNPILEFFCSHLHRPWAYETMRLLRWGQRLLGRLRGQG